MRRYFSNCRNPLHSNKRTSLFGITTLVAILSGLLLFFTNQKQNAQILNSYCGDFGFYGKSLVLLKDSTFRISYHGCSKVNGYVAGRWNSNGQIMTFILDEADSNLNRHYQVNQSELIPVENTTETKFVLCKDYVDPIEEQSREYQQLTTYKTHLFTTLLLIVC